MGQQAGSMKRSTALIRPSLTATQHSFTWQSHRIGTACAVTRGSQNACDRWRSLRSPMTASYRRLSPKLQAEYDRVLRYLRYRTQDDEMLSVLNTIQILFSLVDAPRP